MRVCLFVVMLAGVAFGSLPSWAEPVSRDAFLLRGTGDLVLLCGADPSDPLYTAAQNFCHGFAVGTYRLAAQVEQATPAKTKLFCLPPTPPSRTEALSAFVQWAGAHHDVLTLPPTDGLLRFMVAQFPCK
jgi:hypothetical protein